MQEPEDSVARLKACQKCAKWRAADEYYDGTVKEARQQLHVRQSDEARMVRRRVEYEAARGQARQNAGARYIAAITECEQARAGTSPRPRKWWRPVEHWQ